MGSTIDMYEPTHYKPYQIYALLRIKQKIFIGREYRKILKISLFLKSPGPQHAHGMIVLAVLAIH